MEFIYSFDLVPLFRNDEFNIVRIKRRVVQVENFSLHINLYISISENLIFAQTEIGEFFNGFKLTRFNQFLERNLKLGEKCVFYQRF